MLFWKFSEELTPKFPEEFVPTISPPILFVWVEAAVISQSKTAESVASVSGWYWIETLCKVGSSLSAV